MGSIDNMKKCFCGYGYYYFNISNEVSKTEENKVCQYLDTLVDKGEI